MFPPRCKVVTFKTKEKSLSNVHKDLFYVLVQNTQHFVVATLQNEGMVLKERLLRTRVLFDLLIDSNNLNTILLLKNVATSVLPMKLLSTRGPPFPGETPEEDLPAEESRVSDCVWRTEVTSYFKGETERLR